MPTPDRAVIDAVAKTLATDKASGNLREAQSFGKLVGHDDYAITRLNDEHGVITRKDVGKIFTSVICFASFLIMFVRV